MKVVRKAATPLILLSINVSQNKNVLALCISLTRTISLQKDNPYIFRGIYLQLCKS